MGRLQGGELILPERFDRVDLRSEVIVPFPLGSEL